MKEPTTKSPVSTVIERATHPEVEFEMSIYKPSARPYLITAKVSYTHPDNGADYFYKVVARLEYLQQWQALWTLCCSLPAAGLAAVKELDEQLT